MTWLVRRRDVAERLASGERPSHLDVVTERLGHWARADVDDVVLELPSSERGRDDRAVVVVVDRCSVRVVLAQSAQES